MPRVIFTEGAGAMVYVLLEGDDTPVFSSLITGWFITLCCLALQAHTPDTFLQDQYGNTWVSNSSVGELIWHLIM